MMTIKIESKNPFEGRSSRVIRVLLVNWPKSWALRALAKEANVAVGTVQRVINTLLKENYVVRERRRGELRLMDPLRLLRRWAAYNDFVSRHELVYYYSSEQVIEKFLNKLKSKKGPKYALTALAGALLVAPFVRPTNVFLYIQSKEDVKKWATLLSLRPSEEGGNIVFVIPDDSSVFCGNQSINGINVVSNIQLYVDLFNYPARGEEAASELVKKIEKEFAKERFE